VVDDLGDAVDLVLDGGPCPVGVESTIVDCTVTPPQVLRPGGIPTEQIERLLGDLGDVTGPSRAAGMLASHYAPRCRVLLAADEQQAAELAADRTAAGTDPVVIGVGTDAVSYAQHLYQWLRDADLAGRTAVVALMPPAEGLGHAIRDRLVKASAGRAG
jgi:L-threonylcarbamoyladenylate synthase